MTLELTLRETDYLEHQLYVASRTGRIKTQRRKSWLMISGAFLVLGLLFFQGSNRFLTVYFLICGVASLLFFPLYQRRYYRKHYQNHVRRNFKNRFGVNATLTFGAEQIRITDPSGETKLNEDGVEQVIEAPNSFYLKLKMGEYLIVPKSGIADLESLRAELKILAERQNIPFVSELDWKWKWGVSVLKRRNSRDNG